MSSTTKKKRSLNLPTSNEARRDNSFQTNKVYHGDCMEVIRTFPDNWIDTMITDPPAGIGFMGKEWDKNKGGRDNWIAWFTGIMEEALRKNNIAMMGEKQK